MSRDQIHNEPMLFGCSPEFVLERRDALLANSVLAYLKLTRELDRAEEYCRRHGKWLVIDTRSHMLMPGMYPAIPGWHADAYPRYRYGDQPDLEAAQPDTPHYVVHVSDQDEGVSRTLFAEQPFTCDVDTTKVWASVHRQMECSAISTKRFLDGQIVRMLQPTLHRAAAAYTKGWRWWMRMSCFYKPPENAIRKQVQVYTTEGGGW